MQDDGPGGSLGLGTKTICRIHQAAITRRRTIQASHKHAGEIGSVAKTAALRDLVNAGRQLVQQNTGFLDPEIHQKTKRRVSDVASEKKDAA
jgi:hypothetical protein